MKKPRTFEIYRAQVDLEQVNYYRPCILIPNASGLLNVWILGLSTKNYSERSQTFVLHESHPDFPATGLNATSFTIHPPQEIQRAQLARKLGVLQGALAQDFADWFGV